MLIIASIILLVRNVEDDRRAAAPNCENLLAKPEATNTCPRLGRIASALRLQHTHCHPEVLRADTTEQATLLLLPWLLGAMKLSETVRVADCTGCCPCCHACCGCADFLPPRSVSTDASGVKTITEYRRLEDGRKEKVCFACPPVVDLLLSRVCNVADRDPRQDSCRQVAGEQGNTPSQGARSRASAPHAKYSLAIPLSTRPFLDSAPRRSEKLVLPSSPSMRSRSNALAVRPTQTQLHWSINWCVRCGGRVQVRTL